MILSILGTMHGCFLILSLLPQAQAEELKPLIEQAAHQISAENT